MGSNLHDFLKSIWFKILLIISAVLVGLILFEASTGGLMGPSGVFGAIVKPFSSVTSAITQTVGGFFDGIVKSGDYKKENEELKNQISSIQDKIVDYDSMKQQNEQLKEAVGVKEARVDFEIEPARVIARDTENVHGFTINRGTLNGVNANDPVITNKGIIGVISAVYPTYSQVKTVFSPDLSISAAVSSNGEIGVVSGRADLTVKGLCEMNHLSKESATKQSDIVVTTGSSGIIPAGLKVGEVQEVKVSENGMSSYAIIKPSEDPMTVTNVNVIKNFTGKGSKLPTNN